jgi:hypothetical protein
MIASSGPQELKTVSHGWKPESLAEWPRSKRLTGRDQPQYEKKVSLLHLASPNFIHAILGSYIPVTSHPTWQATGTP